MPVVYSSHLPVAKADSVPSSSFPEKGSLEPKVGTGGHTSSRPPQPAAMAVRRSLRAWKPWKRMLEVWDLRT